MRNRVAVIGVVAVVVIVAVYLAGYLPERGQRMNAEARAEVLDARLTAAEARLRTADLLGRALAIKEVAQRTDYGRAAELSSSFFDAVRTEAMTTPDERLRGGLSDVQAMRDAVTGALARADPASVQVVHGVEQRLRAALGYETVPPVAVDPAP